MLINKLLLKLKKQERKAIKEFKKKLKEELGEQIVEIKLFGSKARGDFNKNSDIDILIVLKDDTERNKDKIFDIVQNILLESEVLLSPVIFNKKEYNYLNDIPTIFMQNVKFEGVSI
ncbi:nucleotidyltransferase domain-containing protein [Patescibacteria group bacterium]|nr:nucleotidyltransferase domain-containing protein [Patescibacteria group bacterium]MBU4482394.1 nucleotidyltransferase domain-containing protein [Patescibacteria group bacterium]